MDRARKGEREEMNLRVYQLSIRICLTHRFYSHGQSTVAQTVGPITVFAVPSLFPQARDILFQEMFI